MQSTAQVPVRKSAASPSTSVPRNSASPVQSPMSDDEEEEFTYEPKRESLLYKYRYVVPSLYIYFFLTCFILL